MIAGYRWVETGRRVWMLEGPRKSRRFHGCVSDNASWYGWWAGYGSNYQQGESGTKREAMEYVEAAMKGGAS